MQSKTDHVYNTTQHFLFELTFLTSLLANTWPLGWFMQRVIRLHCQRSLWDGSLEPISRSEPSCLEVNGRLAISGAQIDTISRSEMSCLGVLVSINCETGFNTILG
jgi:hypothetical protein